MKTYTYEFRRFTELASTIGSDQVKWVTDKLNEIGAEGRRIVNYPQDFLEPSAIRDSAGNPVPRYGIIVLVESESEDDIPAA